MIAICEFCEDVLRTQRAAERPGASGQWLRGPKERSARAYHCARPLEMKRLLSLTAAVALVDGSITAPSLCCRGTLDQGAGAH